MALQLSLQQCYWLTEQVLFNCKRNQKQTTNKPLLGISIFVTGGIGGVHRGAPETFDISADLTELGRTPVCVVCAGAKSILDIGLTLENLETNGVTVVGFGVEEMPAFFTRKSGFKVPLKLDTERNECLIYLLFFLINYC